MKRLLTSAAAVACMWTAALAADIPAYEPAPTVAPVVAPTFDWTGFYAGVQGGWGWADIERETAGVTTSEFEIDGGLLGGHIGAQYQWNWLVFGVEGDLEWANLDGDDGGEGGVLDEVDSNWGASARARLGVGWNRALIYGTVGWQWLDLDIDETSDGTASFDETFDGWTVGGGVDVAVTQNIYAGLEYRYADLGSKDFSASSTCGCAAFTYDAGPLHAVRARIGYKF